MLVTVTDGIATGVRGNPDHPFTRGSLCTKVNDYEDHAYDPARVLYPMRRVGAKGEGRFERISWDDAVAEICGRFRAISAEWGSQAILPVSFTGNISLLNGTMVGDPFMHRLGATVLERTMCFSTRSTAWFVTNGPTVIDPESVVDSRFIVIWGANVLTSNQHLWPFIREARKRGAKVVVIDPYRTRTAAQADWFMPIRPGTDGALALGLVNVLVAEGLVDTDYVERHTTGFEELVERARAFPPDRVEQITGIPAADVRTLARELATIQPSMINVGVAVERSSTGGQAFRAIFSLPALVGSWRHVGGGAIEMPLWGFPVKWDVLSKPEWIQPDTRVLNHMQLGRALTGGLGLDPPVKAILVYIANPATHVPESELVTAGLARDDLFTVVHDLYLTDTAGYADIVLPATTALEHFDMTFSWGHTYFQVNNPAIEPLGEAVSNTELFRRLAAGMGFDDEWFSLTDEQMAAAAIDWDAPAAAGLSLDAMQRDGLGPDQRDARHRCALRRGRIPHPVGEGRDSLVAHRAGGRAVRPAAPPGGLHGRSRTHGPRPGAGLGRTGGRERLAADPHHTQGPCVPQLAVRRPSTPAHDRRPPERPGERRRRRRPQHPRRRPGPGLQRPRFVRGGRRDPQRCRRRHPRLDLRPLGSYELGQRLHSSRAQRDGPRPDPLRRPGRHRRPGRVRDLAGGRVGADEVDARSRTVAGMPNPATAAGALSFAAEGTFRHRPQATNAPTPGRR